MNIIICLDDKNGIQFNKRRQSRDSVLCDRILSITKGRALWMSQYSAKMFLSANVNVDTEFLNLVKDGDYCFVENDDFMRYLDKLEKVIVYRWNRVYPSDKKVATDFLNEKQLTSSIDFKGSSHERITEEIYE